MAQTMGASSVGSETSEQASSLSAEVARLFWMILVGGIPAGVLVVGVGSRLAMLLLRLTSPDFVIGLTSDDGFIIGRFTIGGSYNLLLLGATVGIIGAAAYLAVAPRLIGPWWFRRATTAVASALVVGSMLLQTEGIDFRVLKPTWLAIGLFVALPGLFGLVIGPAVDRAGASVPSPERELRPWLVPAVLLLIFPISIIVATITLLVLIVWRAVAGVGVVRLVRDSKPYGVAISGVWLSITAIGTIALAEDISALV